MRGSEYAATRALLRLVYGRLGAAHSMAPRPVPKVGLVQLEDGRPIGVLVCLNETAARAAAAAAGVAEDDFALVPAREM